MADKSIKSIVVMNATPGQCWKYPPGKWNSKTGKFDLRIDTDGSSSSGGSSTWQGSTSSGVAADKVPFIVIPGYRGSHNSNAIVDLGALGKKKASDWMGYMASVYDPSTKRTCWGICGDVGWQYPPSSYPTAGGWGEVSIKMAWDLGYKNADGRGNGGATQAFVITIYDKYLDSKHRSVDDINKAAKYLGGVVNSNIVEKFIQEAKSHEGEDGTWTWSTSGVVKKPVAWCAGFVIACAKAVGGIIDKVLYPSGTCHEVAKQSTKKKYGTYFKGPYQGESISPEAGDIIFFRWGRKTYVDEYDADHIGIVTKYDAKSKNIHTAEGNYNHVVKLNTYKVNQHCISGIFRPDWAKVGGTAPNGTTGSYALGPLFAKENTREDAIVREVGYLDKNFEPSINVSDIKLSIINYTSLLGDVFDIVRETMSLNIENPDDTYVDGGDPSTSEYINLTWPCPKYKTITNPFTSSSTHSGVDFATGGETNCKIVASEAGTVVLTKLLEYSYGHYIIIKHDKKTKSGKSVYTLYAHNNDLLVKEGQHVERGVQIAKSGSTGKSTGPHCHFEVRLGGQSQSYAVNPANWLPKN